MRKWLIPLLALPFSWLSLDDAVLCLMYSERYGVFFYKVAEIKDDEAIDRAFKDCAYRVKYPDEKRRIEEMFK